MINLFELESFSIKNPNCIGFTIKELGVLRFTLLQFIFCVFAFGDVINHGDKILKFTLSITQHGYRGVPPNHGAILPHVALLHGKVIPFSLPHFLDQTQALFDVVRMCVVSEDHAAKFIL